MKNREHVLLGVDRYTEIIKKMGRDNAMIQNLDAELDSCKCTISQLESRISQLEEEKANAEVEINKYKDLWKWAYERADNAEKDNELLKAEVKELTETKAEDDNF